MNLKRYLLPAIFMAAISSSSPSFSQTVTSYVSGPFIPDPSTITSNMQLFLLLPEYADDLAGFAKHKENKASELKTPSQIREELILSSVRAAHELIKENKNHEALDKLSELDTVPEKSAYDNFLIERTRVAIAATIGDEKLLVKSMEAVVATGQASVGEQMQFVEIIGRAYYNEKNFPQAITWMTRYFKDGGHYPQFRRFLLLSYFFNNDFARLDQELRADIWAEENAGKVPSEEQLKLLISANLKRNDQKSYVNALEKYVAYYPKKEHWADLLNRVLAKPDFSERLTLDVYRLMFATGQVTTAKDYMEMGQLALTSMHPSEAKRIIDQGFQAGILGNGPDAAAHRHLRDAATKYAASAAKAMDKETAEILKGKKGNSLFELGEGYADRGMLEKGISLMEQGILAGSLKHPAEARLHLGFAYVSAGRNENAIQLFKTVQGSDGSSDLARYWVIHLNGTTTAMR